MTYYKGLPLFEARAAVRGSTSLLLVSSPVAPCASSNSNTVLPTNHFENSTLLPKIILHSMAADFTRSLAYLHTYIHTYIHIYLYNYIYMLYNLHGCVLWLCC